MTLPTSGTLPGFERSANQIDNLPVQAPVLTLCHVSNFLEQVPREPDAECHQLLCHCTRIHRFDYTGISNQNNLECFTMNQDRMA